MRLFILFLTLLSFAGADRIPERCSSSTNCKSCHGHLVKDWEKSWHARSHYEKNEYYQKSVDYLARKTYKSKDRVMLGCAKCHNPRIGVDNASVNESYNHAFGIKNENSPLAKAVASELIKEGINCIVCHKIDTISPIKKDQDQGNAVLTWLEAGTIGGPFHDAKANFHKSKQQSFFKNPDTLCLVCHNNMQSLNGLEIADTGKEFHAVKSQKSCADCHMSEKSSGFAALVPNANGVKVRRQIRRHKFAGAHHANIIKDALKLDIKVDAKKVTALLFNPNPHAVPTGFGGRELIIEARFFNGKKMIVKKRSLTTHYQSRRKHKTIPHFAAAQTKNHAVPAKGQKSVTFSRIKGSDAVEIKVWYRLVNDEIRDLLQLKEKRWSKMELITSKHKKL